jgi:DNA-directed RNA polymerase subunit RPC12/RpoP
MMRTMTCDQCTMEFEVSNSSAGLHVRCQYCESWVVVPETPPADVEDVPMASAAPDLAEPVSPGRRSRRRRRPRPKSRSAWPIIALILLVIFGLCGGSAGLFFWAARPQWWQYDSPGGGFSVELPAAPNKDMKRLAGIKENEIVSVEGTLLLSRLEDYAIVYAEIDPTIRRNSTDDQVVQLALDGMIAETAGTKVLHDEWVTVTGWRAREVGLSIPGDGQALSRLVVAGTRLYVVAAGGRFASYNDPRLRRFIDSFRITGGANPAGRWK